MIFIWFHAISSPLREDSKSTTEVSTDSILCDFLRLYSWFRMNWFGDFTSEWSLGALRMKFSNHSSWKFIKSKKSFFVQRKVVRNNNCVFLLWIDLKFYSFLVEFCQYLEYSIRFFKLFTWNLLLTNCFCVIYI